MGGAYRRPFPVGAGVPEPRRACVGNIIDFDFPKATGVWRLCKSRAAVRLACAPDQALRSAIDIANLAAEGGVIAALYASERSGSSVASHCWSSVACRLFPRQGGRCCRPSPPRRTAAAYRSGCK